MAVKAQTKISELDNQEESERLAELYSYGILDTPDERDFDEIAKIAAAFFDVPMAVISFVDADRQWFKAKVGLEASETPREIAFCSHTIQKDEVLVVPDATLDLRFARNPLVTGGLKVRFYAGAPLITAKRNRLGTLCLIDQKPRQLTAVQQEMLAMLSRQVVSQMELKKLGKRLLEKNTELEKAQKELQKNSQFLSQLVNSLPIGVFCKDVKDNFKITMWNQNMAQRSGVPASVATGKTVFDLLSKKEAEFAQSKDEEVVRLKKMVETPEEVIEAGSGKKSYIHIRKVPLFNEAGECQYLLAISEDITEKKEAQSLVIQASKMSSLGEMAAGIAHEINNPLAVIRGKSQILSEMVHAQKLSPEAVQVCADKINETTVRISKIISGLRNFAREGSQDPFWKTRVQELVDGVKELSFHNLKSKGVDFQISAFDPKLAFDCRSVQIIQVLVNLLNNSLDAIREMPTRWIRLDVLDLGNEIEISVTDSGPGIPLEIQERMMQPFFTTKEVGKGTGLGLSISKGIVESHQGQFWYNKQSANTSFVFRVPKARGSRKS